MATSSNKQARRCETWIVDEYGPRRRQLDEIVYLRNDVVIKRIPAAEQFDTILLNFAGGPEDHHRLELNVVRLPETKKPAESGLGVKERAFAVALFVFAAIGAFVTVASVASALN